MFKRTALKPPRGQFAALAAAGVLALTASPAQAHVKWFSKVVNCMSTPLSPLEVLSAPYFVWVYLAAVITILGVYLVERRLQPRFEQINLAAAARKARISVWAGHLLRLGVAIYFVSLISYSTDRHMILTPELLTTASWVPGIQAVIALAVLWRRTTPIAAAGLVGLFGYAAWQYGLFHMMDYPYFLGVAVFLVLDSLYGVEKHYLGFAAFRLSAGISLLWVSVEKWMYPAWAYDILNHELHGITMGIDTPFFVMAAGFVEFCLAFLLLFGRVSSQVSALILLVVRVSAIPLVGALDAVGHAPLLVALIIFTAVQNRIGYPTRNTQRWMDGGHVLSFAICVPGLLGLYHFSHLLSYPERATFSSLGTLASGALVVLLTWRVSRTLPELFPLRKRTAAAVRAPAFIRCDMSDLMRLRS